MVPDQEISKEPVADLGILCCPKCSDRLEPLFLDTSGAGNDRKQTIWWTCRWVSSKKCNFPLNMPSNVYWVTRNGSEIDRGFVPLPQVNLLPRCLQYLYPQIFPDSPRPSKETVFSLDSLSSSSSSPVSKSVRVRRNVDETRESRQFLYDALKNKKTASLEQQVTRRPALHRSFYRNRVKTNSHEEIEPDMKHVKFNSELNPKPVEVFPNQKGALSSLINLRYSHDTFIGNLNSEMCRKKILTPTPAVDPRQRAQMASNSGGLTICDFMGNTATSRVRYVYRDKGERDRKKRTHENKEKRFCNLLASLPKQLNEKSIVARLGLPVTPRRDCDTPTSTEASNSTTSTSTGSRGTIEPADSIDNYIKSTGNLEVDQLIRQQFRNVLKNKKLRRKKGSRPRTPTSTPQPTPQDSVMDEADLFGGFTDRRASWPTNPHQNSIPGNNESIYHQLDSFNFNSFQNQDETQEILQERGSDLNDSQLTSDPHHSLYDLDTTAHFDDHHGLDLDSSI